MGSPQPLHLSYNFTRATMEQRSALSRDHAVVAGKFKLFQVPIESALLALRDADDVPDRTVPDKASCEFAWQSISRRLLRYTARASLGGGHPVRQSRLRVHAAPASNGHHQKWRTVPMLLHCRNDR